MFCVLLFVLGVSGAHAGCCSPETYETWAWDLNSPGGELFWYRIAQDDHLKMQGMVKLDHTKTRVVKHYVNDFKTMQQYTLYPDEQRCDRDHLLQPFISREDCQNGIIPRATDIQKLGTLAVGLHPTKALDTEVTSFVINGIKYWQGMARIDENTCIPIYHRIQIPSRGENKPAHNFAFIGFNATERVTYPGMFTIPDYCQTDDK